METKAERSLSRGGIGVSTCEAETPIRTRTH